MLTLKRSGKALVEFEQFVITNDLGFVPKYTPLGFVIY